MVLVGLDQVEVVAIADGESVMAVKLEQSSDNRVATSHALNTCDGVARLQHGAIPPIGVVEGLLSLVGANNGVIARHEGVTLDNPHKLLARVVEVQLQLVGGAGDGLTASELEHVDQVLMRHLGKLASLISVQVDVVDVQGGSGQASLGNTVADRVGVGASGIVPAQVVECVELQVEADLVVLESNQWQG